MSEPIRKPGHAPESYQPRKPKILSIAEQVSQSEKLVETFTVGKAVFEVFDRPEVLWVGTLAWADNNHDEPDTGALLKKYQSLVYSHPQREFRNPGWSAGISINYCLGGRAPRGMLFAAETWSAKQDSCYDVFTQPAGLYFRMRLDKHARKLIGKKNDDGAQYALMEKVAAQHGYRRALGNPIEMFYHDHENGTAAYAIIPVEKAPEAYQPRKPEIMKLAEQAREKTEERGASTGNASPGGSGILPNIRGIFDGMQGHNYGLPDCLAFIWEHLNETIQPDYWDFAAATGDSVAMVYNRNPSTLDEYCVSGYLAGPEHIAHCFNVIGYGHSYVTAEQINADKEKYLRQVMFCIDKGLPVLALTSLTAVPGWHSDVGDYCLVVGYEDQALVLNIGIKDDGGWLIKYDTSGQFGMDLIFVGEKQRELTMEELYLSTAKNMTHWLTLPERDGMFFGAAAFRAWADDIEAGRYKDRRYKHKDHRWSDYGVFVCNLATSPGVPFFVFKKLAEINPIYARCMKLHDEIVKVFPAHLPDDCVPEGSKDRLWSELERLGGGLYAKHKALRNKRKRRKIAAALRGYAERLDKVVRILEKGAREV